MRKIVKPGVFIAAQVLLTATFAWGVTPNPHNFAANEKAKVEGVILSRDGNTLKVRITDDSIGTIDLSDITKIQLKKGVSFCSSIFNERLESLPATIVFTGPPTSTVTCTQIHFFMSVGESRAVPLQTPIWNGHCEFVGPKGEETRGPVTLKAGEVSTIAYPG